jgi:hypothetical protein
MKHWCCIAGVVCLLLALPASSQAPPSAASTQSSSESGAQSRPQDVKTMDGIIAALYDVISGPPTQKRDWNRMRSLFVPGARLIPTGVQPSGKAAVHLLSLDDYISRSEPLMQKEGFFESELSRRTEQFANIAHVWSTYESRHQAGEKPFARGINSIQLMNDGDRWWIVNILWQGESAQHQLPGQYLQQGKP